MSETTSTSPLTVVLVHGAFADSSSWAGVIERLQAKGHQVVAAANPLRGISHDSAYVASLFAQIPGRVLAVGHSYGGAVISNAATACAERCRLGLRGGLRTRRRREAGRRHWGVKGQRARHCVGAAPLPDRERYGHRVLDRPGEGPRRLCRRPLRRPGNLDRSDPTTGRGSGVRGAVRSAGMEDAAVVGGRGHQRPGRGNGCRAGPCRTRRR